MDKFKLEGLINIVVKDKEGNIKDTREVKNVITNASLAEISGLVGNTGSKTAFTYLAVGTGTTAAEAADTALETEVADSGLERAAATVSQVTTTVTNDTLKLAKTFTVTGSVAITEAGALNAASDGTLLGHQVFAAVNVVNTDSFVLEYSFKFASA